MVLLTNKTRLSQPLSPATSSSQVGQRRCLASSAQHSQPTISTRVTTASASSTRSRRYRDGIQDTPIAQAIKSACSGTLSAIARVCRVDAFHDLLDSCDPASSRMMVSAAALSMCKLIELRLLAFLSFARVWWIWTGLWATALLPQYYFC